MREESYYSEYYNKYGEGYFNARNNQTGLIFNEAIEFPAVKKIFEAIHFEPGDKVLDIGCGFGFYTKYFAAKGLNVTAIDGSKKMIALAREYCAGFDNITFINQAWEKVYSSLSTFDIVIGNFILSYFSNIDFLFSSIEKVATDECTILLSMLHPLVQSKTTRTAHGYFVEDYFSDRIFESDFLDKKDKITLHKWNLNEIFTTCKRNNLYVDEILEPKPEVGGRWNKDLIEFYRKCPSVIIFKIKKRQ